MRIGKLYFSKGMIAFLIIALVGFAFALFPIK